MKKIKIILLCTLLSALTYTNTKPVNFTINLSSAYDSLKISDNQIKKAGLVSILDKGYKSHKIMTNLGVAISKKVNVGKVDLNLGVGADVLFEANLQKQAVYSTNNDEKIAYINALKINVQELENELNKINEEYNEINYSYTVANNKVIEYTKLEKMYSKDILNNKKKIEETEKAKEKYTDEKIAEFSKEFKTLETEIDEINKTQSLLEEELTNKKKEYKNNLVAILDMPNNTPEEQRAKTEFYQKNIKDLNKKIGELENKVEELSSSKIGKFIRRNQILKIEEAYKRDVEKLKEEISKLEAKNAENSENISHYESKKSEYKTKKIEILEKKDALEEETSGKISSLEEKIALLTSSEIIENDNSKTRTLVIERLNSSKYYGGSLYAKVAVSGEVAKEVELFGNIETGVKITNNPLYAIAIELQEKSYKVDGNYYAKPEQLKNIEFSPFVNLGLGVKYKGFISEVFTGYNKGLLGLKLGYEF